MTRERLITAIEKCLEKSKYCDKYCPLYSINDCGRFMKEAMLNFLKEQPTATPEAAQATPEAVQAPGPDLIGSVMRQFKKPIITISISDMEDSQ